MALEGCQPWSKTEYLTKVRAKQGMLTFREGLGADLAAERLGGSVILLAGSYSGYFQGWIHFDLTWAFRYVGNSPRPEQSGH